VLPVAAAAFAAALRAIPASPDRATAVAARASAQRFSAERQLDRMIALYRDLREPAGAA